MGTGIVKQALVEKLRVLQLQAREWAGEKVLTPWQRRAELAMRELKREIGKWDYWGKSES